MVVYTIMFGSPKGIPNKIEILLLYFFSNELNFIFRIRTFSIKIGHYSLSIHWLTFISSNFKVMKSDCQYFVILDNDYFI